LTLSSVADEEALVRMPRVVVQDADSEENTTEEEDEGLMMKTPPN
jgi:hypothetical protein